MSSPKLGADALLGAAAGRADPPQFQLDGPPPLRVSGKITRLPSENEASAHSACAAWTQDAWTQNKTGDRIQSATSVEPLQQDAHHSLVSLHRSLGLPADELIKALLEKSVRARSMMLPWCLGGGGLRSAEQHFDLDLAGEPIIPKDLQRSIDGARAVVSAECPRNPFDARSWWHLPNRTAAQGWHQGGGANDLHITDSASTCTSCRRRWQQRGLGTDRPQATDKSATILRIFNAEHHAGRAGGGS